MPAKSPAATSSARPDQAALRRTPRREQKNLPVEDDVPITTRALTASDWPVIETLFGKNGACGGCWCMLWRVPRGGKLWEEVKGEKNKQAFRRLVKSGKVYGALAFAGDEPVGWCSVGPRSDFPRLATIKALQTPWTPGTWSVTCFFIRSRWQRRGIGTLLLAEAVKVAKANGASDLEGYPIVPRSDKVPGVFAWTGLPALFEKHKFIDITPPDNPRPIYRKAFRRS